VRNGGEGEGGVFGGGMKCEEGVGLRKGGGGEVCCFVGEGWGYGDSGDRGGFRGFGRMGKKGNAGWNGRDGLSCV
jgi:hypothetical protein